MGAWHYGFGANPRDRAHPAQLERGSWEPPGGDHGRIHHGLPSFVPPRFHDPIAKAALRHNVPMDLLAAQLYAESNFNPFARSPAGAQGIAQFMPGTARAYGLSDPFDAEQAIDAQARLMADLLRQFGGRPALALAAYNAGPGAVRALRRGAAVRRDAWLCDQDPRSARWSGADPGPGARTCSWPSEGSAVRHPSNRGRYPGIGVTFEPWQGFSEFCVLALALAVGAASLAAAAPPAQAAGSASAKKKCKKTHTLRKGKCVKRKKCKKTHTLRKGKCVRRKKATPKPTTPVVAGARRT